MCVHCDVYVTRVVCLWSASNCEVPSDPLTVFSSSSASVAGLPQLVGVGTGLSLTHPALFLRHCPAPGEVLRWGGGVGEVGGGCLSMSGDMPAWGGTTGIRW